MIFDWVKVLTTHWYLQPVKKSCKQTSDGISRSLWRAGSKMRLVRSFFFLLRVCGGGGGCVSGFNDESHWWFITSCDLDIVTWTQDRLRRYKVWCSHSNTFYNQQAYQYKQLLADSGLASYCSFLTEGGHQHDMNKVSWSCTHKHSQNSPEHVPFVPE